MASFEGRIGLMPTRILDDRMTDWERSVDTLESISTQDSPLTAPTRKYMKDCLFACHSGVPRQVSALPGHIQEAKEEVTKRVSCAVERIFRRALTTDFSSVVSTFLEREDLGGFFYDFLKVLHDQKSLVLMDAEIAKKLLRYTPYVIGLFDKTIKEDRDIKLLDRVLNDITIGTEKRTKKLLQLSDSVKCDKMIMKTVFRGYPQLFRYLEEFKKQGILPLVELFNEMKEEIIKDKSDNDYRLLSYIMSQAPEVYASLDDDRKYSKWLLKFLVPVYAFSSTNRDQIKEIILDIFDHLPLEVKEEEYFFDFVASDVVLLIPEIISHLSDSQKYNKELLEILVGVLKRKGTRISPESHKQIEEYVAEIQSHLLSTQVTVS